jgi:CheY-like chemotaxis protein
MSVCGSADRCGEPFLTADRGSKEAGVQDRALSVLLVEDDLVDVMNVQRAFKKNHILNPLVVAADGAEALELLRTGRVGTSRLLVLLDLDLPRTGGIDFLRQLREDSSLRDVPVLVLTSSDEERRRLDAQSLSVSGYIQKPVTLLGLMEAISSMNKYWELVELP